MRFEAPQQILSSLVILLALSYLHLSIGLRCWSCRGKISVDEFKSRRGVGPECGDPFLNASAMLDDCDSRESSLHTAWCRKTIQRSKNVIIFERSCDLNHEEVAQEYELGNRNGRQNNVFQPVQHRCASRADPNGDFMDDCWCRGQDGCNSFQTDLSLALRSSSGWSLKQSSHLGLCLAAILFSSKGIWHIFN